MGFRNRLEGEVLSVDGDLAEIAVGDARLRGRMRESVKPGARAVLAVRPDDLVAVPAREGTLSAPVISRSEEHTSELQSLMRISYAVFCLKKKKKKILKKKKEK